MIVIEAKDLTKTYNPNTIPVHAVNTVSLEISKGEFTAIVGPSGCGKTSLLNLLGGLDEASSGAVTVGGTTLNGLSEKQLTDFRLKHIGFVFQSYNLIPVLSARENIEFIMLLQKVESRKRRERVDELLNKMNITEQGDRRPSQLSGGQQQRVAVARALASRPQLILADEPTANLDSHATSALLDLMHRMNEDEGATFVFSTHDQRVIDKATRIIMLEDGKVVNDQRK